MSISSTRGQHRSSAKRLKRARRLYVSLCKKAIEADHTKLWYCAKRMLEGQLYASSQERDARFGILRQMSKLDGTPCCETLGLFRRSGGRGFWWEWLKEKGWDLKWHEVYPCG